MLAVFHNSLAEPSLKLMGTVVVTNPPTEESEEAMKELSRLFKDEHQDAMAIHLLPHCILNTVLDHQSVITPSVLAVKDDVVCLFRGRFENRTEFSALYQLPIPKNDAAVAIWAYNKFRVQENDDETPWLEAVKRFKGGFSFVIYDAKKKSVFVTSSLDGTVPCFWGFRTILFSSCLEIASTNCEIFYGALPKGCYFATRKGLRNLQSPDEVLKPEFVPPENH